MLGLDIFLKIGDLGILIAQVSPQQTDNKLLIFSKKTQAHNKLYTWHLGANVDCFFLTDILSPKAQYKYYSWHLGANA